MTDSISTARTGKGDMIWGILMLICGFLAITLPLASGIGVAIVIGWLLLMGGVWHLLFGFRSGSGIGRSPTTVPERHASPDARTAISPEPTEIDPLCSSSTPTASANRTEWGSSPA